MADGEILEALVCDGLRYVCYGQERKPGLWVFDCGFHLLLQDLMLDPTLDMIGRAHEERHTRLKRDERDFLLLMRGIPNGVCEARLQPCSWALDGRYQGEAWWW